MATPKYENTKVKLSIGERINYSVSEFGYNCIYIWISAFMTIFFTDYIGVPAASVSLLLLLVRVFDAINDPIIGSIADRTRSKWGRYKPWVAIGGSVMTLLIVLLFAAQPTWPMGLKLAWMWGIYILVTVASTCCNMPYGALNGVITSDTEERTKLSGMRMVFANVGSNFTNLIAASLILALSGTNGTTNTAQGYFWAVLIVCVLGLPTMIWSAVKSKERVQPPPEQAAKGNKIPFGLQMKCLLGNKYTLCCIFGAILVGFMSYGRMTIMAYYFTYFANNFALYAYTGVVGIVTGIVGSGWLCPLLYKIFKHKGRGLAFGFGVAAVLSVPMYWFTPDTFAFWFFYAVSYLFLCGAGALRYSCDGDTVDFAEYKYGVRVDGFLASFISLASKAGGAIGPAVMLAWLDLLGYIPNAAQNAGVLNALNICMSILPGALLLACSLAFLFIYDMDGKKHGVIVAELERRRGINQ